MIEVKMTIMSRAARIFGMIPFTKANSLASVTSGRAGLRGSSLSDLGERWFLLALNGQGLVHVARVRRSRLTLATGASGAAWPDVLRNRSRAIIVRRSERLRAGFGAVFRATFFWAPQLAPRSRLLQLWP